MFTIYWNKFWGYLGAVASIYMLVTATTLLGKGMYDKALIYFFLTLMVSASSWRCFKRAGVVKV